MEIVGEYLSFKTNKGIYKYFKRHWAIFFPDIPDRSNFIRQSANLWKMKQYLFDYFKKNQDKWLQILDSMPIEVCKFVRAKNTRLFKDTASYGKWFGQTFFGYRLHLKITESGIIQKFIIAFAVSMTFIFTEELLENDSYGWVIADKGYRSKPLHDRLWQQKRIYFHTSFRRVDKKPYILPKTTVRKLSGKRRLIETVAGQLEEYFSIKKINARDLWHLFNRIIRKILSHTFCTFMNIMLNRSPLKLKGLVC